MSQDKSDRPNVNNMLDFLANAPEDPDIIKMDCNEHCEELAVLAERVANGEDLKTILPALEKHMQYWGDCREEFNALVSVLKAEMGGNLPDIPGFDADQS